MRRFGAAAILLLLTLPDPAGAGWQAFRQPAKGPAAAIGRYNAGCLKGGRALPPEGKGYQVMRLSRNRYYGHPELVRFIERLGEAVRRERLGVMLVGDLSMPRGGPFSHGHRSHQTGLDVDIALRLDLPRLPRAKRERYEPLDMVRGDGRDVDPRRWGTGQAKLVELAARDPAVARIFVNPAIKRALCRSARGDREWLRRVRPWFAHRAHLHVRLRCPGDDDGCIPQADPPPGDGCGSELASWFRPPDSGRKPAPPKPRPPLPPVCRAMVGG